MESTFRVLRTNDSRELLLAIDVSKDSLAHRCYLPAADDAQGRRVVEDVDGTCKRRSGPMRKLLAQKLAQAKQAGLEHLRVICEPTGGYEESVLRMARQMGCLTSYVNGESVSKAKVIDHNDSGKSDPVDTRVILTVGAMGKVLTHRQLPAQYQQLRLLNRNYSSVARTIRSLKCEISSVIGRLFCDLSRKADAAYTKSGCALMRAYGYNPYRIAAAGRSRFERAMRRRHRGIQAQTLQQLWDDACSSVLHQMAPGEAALRQQHLEFLWQAYELHERQRQQLRLQMVVLYEQLVAQKEPLPQAHKRFLSAFCIARIVAETGPLSDFGDIRALIKYAGLNLCRRQSGRFEGHIKISHKGSCVLRAALGEAAFHLVSKNACFGAYYQRKKTQDKMKFAQALVAVMRKLLGAIWSMAIKHTEFDEQRLFTGQSVYRTAA
jgi:transposase